MLLTCLPGAHFTQIDEPRCPEAPRALTDRRLMEREEPQASTRRANVTTETMRVDEPPDIYTAGDCADDAPTETMQLTGPEGEKLLSFFLRYLSDREFCRSNMSDLVRSFTVTGFVWWSPHGKKVVGLNLEFVGFVRVPRLPPMGQRHAAWVNQRL